MLTLDDIARLAQTHPVINQALTQYRRGDAELQQALYAIIVGLAAQLEETQAQLRERIQSESPPIVIRRQKQ